MQAEASLPNKNDTQNRPRGGSSSKTQMFLSQENRTLGRSQTGYLLSAINGSNTLWGCDRIHNKCLATEHQTVLQLIYWESPINVCDLTHLDLDGSCQEERTEDDQQRAHQEQEHCQCDRLVGDLWRTFLELQNVKLQDKAHFVCTALADAMWNKASGSSDENISKVWKLFCASMVR